MKTRLFVGVVAVLFMAVAVTAYGVVGPVFTIQVDENGNMLINGNPGPQGVPGVDPSSGAPALVYALPFAGNPGDLLMLSTNEPPAAGQQSDIIRFLGNGNMYFFSLQDDTSAPDLADVPVLPPPSTLNLPLLEVGPEGSNGALWTPGPGGIGGDPANPSLQYNFISDAVPEPGTVTLVGLSLAGLLAVIRRKK